MYIAIDVGGTNIRVAGFKSLNQPKITKIFKFPVQNNYQVDFKNIVKAILKITGSKIKGIGLCLPGIITQGEIKKYPHLSDWNNKPINKDLSNLFKSQVVLENDAIAGGVAEAIYSDSLNNENFLFITWGTGIGGVYVYLLNKKIYLLPLEPGHQIINWDEKLKCECGQRGCWEFLCAGRGIQKKYKKQPTNLSEKEWEKIIEYFSQGLINLITITSPNLIILAGGIAINQKKRINQIKKILKKRLKIYPLPRIKISKFGENVGLYGALGLFKTIL